MIKRMATELISTPMEHFISETGSRINNTARALKLGQMGHGTTVHTKMERKMARAPLHLQMAVSTQVISL